MNPLDDASRYQHYVYAYPHKTAYRRIEPGLDLAELWAGEHREQLFVYLHVPFCEIRCGFCNLFTQPVPEADRVEAYLATLARQVAVVRRALDAGGPFAFARAAIGGGTPTLLDAAQLERAIDLLRAVGTTKGIPMSVETSPETALPDRLAVVVDHGGADRISIGVQSFVDDECKAVNRPQRAADVHRALRAIRDAGPATLNVDLMYGLPGQTEATWRGSLEAALEYRPEELYLYPLYVRPLTTLGRRRERDGVHPEDAARVALYEQARATLLESGYRQVSMRMFRRGAMPASTAYCCQDDGMIGLGCGARSYTRRVHYSSEWAVGARSVREIIDRWIVKPDEAFAVADYGFVLDDDEQRRRWLILSLLSDDGLDLAAYQRRWGEPDLGELASYTTRADGTLRLTPDGLARADAIGPALFSEAVRRRMTEYELSVKLDILYRGPLASCNYGCAYCPFAKRKDSREQLAVDRAQWRRFCDWLVARSPTDELGILVTPWGEALIRRWYQDGLAELSHLPQIRRVAAQTNLSGPLDWITAADAERLALWCTFHPEWTTLDDFLAQCTRLLDGGVRFSVGVVGQREHHAAAVAIRAALPADTYVWINAVKALDYAADELAAWEAIDPLFRLNTQRWPSAGSACGAGERAITVDGEGTMRRCHFIAEPIGNIYEADWRAALVPRACSNVDCHCHIGYVHLDYLELHKVFASGLLERVPVPEARAGLRLPVVG